MGGVSPLSKKMDVRAISRDEEKCLKLEPMFAEIERAYKGKPIDFRGVNLEDSFRSVTARELKDKHASAIFLTKPGTKKIHSMAVCSREPEFEKDNLRKHALDTHAQAGLTCHLMKVD